MTAKEYINEKLILTAGDVMLDFNVTIEEAARMLESWRSRGLVREYRDG